MQTISPTTVEFLKALSAHNSREWFHANQSFYQQARQEFAAFIAELLKAVDTFHPLGMIQPKDCIYRQQRDVRFSPDKTPYTTHMSALIAPGGKKTPQVPFYIRIKPDGVSMLGAGAWGGSAPQLYRIRQEIDYNPQPLQAILHHPDFQQYFGAIQGESLKRPPKGYAPDHPHLDLLKRKEWYVQHTLTEKEYLRSGGRSENFLPYATTVLKAAKPLVDYLNEAWEEEE